MKTIEPAGRHHYSLISKTVRLESEIGNGKRWKIVNRENGIPSSLPYDSFERPMDSCE